MWQLQDEEMDWNLEWRTRKLFIVPDGMHLWRCCACHRLVFPQPSGDCGRLDICLRMQQDRLSGTCCDTSGVTLNVEGDSGHSEPVITP